MKRLYMMAVAALCSLSLCSVSNAVPTFYGYQMGDKGLKFGFVSFTADSFSEFTMLKATNMYYKHLSAGEYLDGRLYAYTVEPDDFGAMYSASFVVYDAETFEILDEIDRSDGVRVVDMTYDYSTNTMYALAEEEFNTEAIGITNLCVVDLETGGLTVVGSTGGLKGVDGYGHEVDAALVTLAADAAGNLYAMSEYRQFCKLDKFTGKATQIGETHKLAVTNQFQSMTFADDGTLYWAQQHPDYGWFTTIDTQTGEPTKLGTLGNDAQVTALFVKKDLDKTFPKAVTGLSAKVDETAHNTVHLTWTLPSTDYAGQPVTVKTVKVYRFGVSEPIAELAGTATSYDDENADNGYNTYLVAAESETATGTPATVRVFAGYDKLRAVGNIAISLDGDAVSLTWTAPTATVNGGYADFDNITYNVYRNKGEESVIVAEGITECKFGETLSTPGAYTYTVEPVSGGVVGEGATSDEVKIVGVASIPYSTGFEDDGDGPLWTVINNHDNASYGWSVLAGYAYQQLDGSFAQLKTGGSGDTGRDWLISPPIHFEPGTYKMTYYAGNGTSIDKHSWEVKLGTDVADVSSFTLSIGRHEDVSVSTDWELVNETEFSVAEAGDYRVGFYGFSQSTYASFKLDNLSIVSTSSGINDVAVDGGITVSGDVVTVSAAAGVGSWQVFNLQGQALLQGDACGVGSADIGLGSLGSGVYVVKVTLGDGKILASKVVCR